MVRVSSRRGSLEVPVHIDEILTLDAWDPKSGTAEFKATAIRVDKLDAAAPDGSETQRAKAGG